MDNGQNLANEIQEIDVAVRAANPEPLTPQQQMWIDYNALGGLIVDNTDERWDSVNQVTTTMRKMSISEFAKMIDVSRETLRLWRNSIPDFWGKVNVRRQELAPRARLQKMHEVWFLSALKTGAEGFRDRQMWLANFDKDFRMPAQKMEHDIGDNLAELLIAAKRDGIIEGEVVNGPNDATAGSANPGALPAKS
jgi:hypothetical protein